MIIYAWNNFDRHLAKYLFDYFDEWSDVKFGDKSEFLKQFPKSKTLEHSVICTDGYKDYVIIDHYDWNDIDCYEVLDSRKCIALLKCQYNPAGYKHEKILPYTYLVRDAEKFYPLADSHKKEVGDRLYFQGNLRYGRQSQLERIESHLNADWRERSTLEQYVSRLGNAQLALSLKGHGGHCHREHEAFYLKTPVAMPELENTFYEPLIAGVHYIPLRDLEKDIATAHDKITTEMVDAAYDWHKRNVLGCAKLVQTILRESIGYDFCG